MCSPMMNIIKAPLIVLKRIFSSSSQNIYFVFYSPTEERNLFSRVWQLSLVQQVREQSGMGRVAGGADRAPMSDVSRRHTFGQITFGVLLMPRLWLLHGV